MMPRCDGEATAIVAAPYTVQLTRGRTLHLCGHHYRQHAAALRAHPAVTALTVRPNQLPPARQERK